MCASIPIKFSSLIQHRLRLSPCAIKEIPTSSAKKEKETVHYSLHSSNGSSELSPQSSSTSHFQLWGIQRPLRHLNCPGRHILVEQWVGSSSDWSPQSSSPSHCHDSGIHRLFAHCHWWVSHWWVAGRKTSQISWPEQVLTFSHKKQTHNKNILKKKQ